MIKGKTINTLHFDCNQIYLNVQEKIRTQSQTRFILKGKDRYDIIKSSCVDGTKMLR